jgi:hypothetical protein
MSRHFYNFLISIPVVAFLALPLTFLDQSASQRQPEEFIGDNSFHCVINNGAIQSDSQVNAELVRSPGSFYLNLWLGKSRENRITFALNDEEVHTGTYAMDDPSKRYISFMHQQLDCGFSSDEYYDGFLMIHKFDTLQNILAGSFEFTAASPFCNSIVMLREGTFDVTYSEGD